MMIDIVICSNRSEKLEECVDALKNLKTKYDFNVTIVDDASNPPIRSDFTRVLRNNKNQGWARSKNKGIKATNGSFVALLDDDNITELGWLDYLMIAMDDPEIGAVTSVGIPDGHSIIYRRAVFHMCGYFDTKFNRNLRQDTDLNWRIMDKGWRIKVLDKPMFEHKYPTPKGKINTLKWFWNRTLNHMNDVLLAKKHIMRYEKFFDVKWGFIVNPMRDFRNATNLWGDPGKEMKLSSPHGGFVTKNKLLTILGGITYMILVKFVRLYGSLKYRFLMI